MQLHFNRSDTDFEANAFDPRGSIYQSDYHQNLPQVHGGKLCWFPTGLET